MQINQSRDDHSDRFLRRRHRLGVIGDLTADLAHHLNNLATSVMGTAGLIERSVERSDAAGEHLDSLRRAARAIGEATRTLQNFAVREPGPHAPVRFDALVAEVAQMLHLPASVRLMQAQQPTDPITVLGSAADLRHLVATMLLIAREATEARGEIEILLTTDAERCTLTIEARPDVAGSAMAEPFWGSAGSMRVIGSIATDHGARLTNGSDPGCTSIELPVLTCELTPTSPGPDAGGGNLVLLQISDRQTRSLLASALAGTGFRVMQASTPDDAERIIVEAKTRKEFPGALVIEHAGPLPSTLHELGAPVVLIRDPDLPSEPQQSPRLAAVLTRPYKMVDLVRTLTGVVNDRKGPHTPEA